MTTTTAVSVEELEAMLEGEHPVCDFPTLEKKDHECKLPCGLPAVFQWRAWCPEHGESTVWACREHHRMVLEGIYSRCGSLPNLWVPA